MHEALNKYFWDGIEGYSEKFKLRRIIEYASFPDLLKYPFDKVQKYLPELNIDKFRTGEKRKKFIKIILLHLSDFDSWEEIIWGIVAPRFKTNEKI